MKENITFSIEEKTIIKFKKKCLDKKKKYSHKIQELMEEYYKKGER